MLNAKERHKQTRGGILSHGGWQDTWPQGGRGGAGLSDWAGAGQTEMGEGSPAGPMQEELDMIGMQLGVQSEVQRMWKRNWEVGLEKEATTVGVLVDFMLPA